MAISYETIGRLAFEAYAQMISGPIRQPSWDSLSRETRFAWRAAAAAVMQAETPARGEVRMEAETRETDPTPDGWRQYEPTGLVIISGDLEEVRRLIRRLDGGTHDRP